MLRNAIIAIGLWVACAAVHGANAPVAEARVALVIGNGAYRHEPLLNPVNDAQDMARALREFGFKVLVKTDGSQRDMRNAIREFGGELRKADVGLFFYAGHGIQIRGNNYLVPVDADVQSEADAEDLSIDVNYVLRTMEEAQVKVSIVVLDACRNNPFARSFRSSARGLAQMSAATGSLIAFATAPGSVAADGTGRNGLYTKYLLESMHGSDTQILKVFQQTRAAVVRATNGKQTPWESTSLIGDFYFRPPAVAPTLASAQPLAPAAPSAMRALPKDLESPRFLEELEDLVAASKSNLLDIARRSATGDALAQARWCAISTFPKHTRRTSLKPEEGVALCKQLADQGIPVGMYLYGLALMYGRGLQTDPDEAIRWYRRASDAGSGLASNALGFAYETGHGVAKDGAQAFKWFSLSAERGVPLGMKNLGWSHEQGIGTAVDFTRAAEWYRKAAELGEPSAMTSYGYALESGRGVAKDDAQALDWYRKAAHLGEGMAMNNIGVFYANGRGGLSKDAAQATAWYEKAIASGNSRAKSRAEANLGKLKR